MKMQNVMIASPGERGRQPLNASRGVLRRRVWILVVVLITPCAALCACSPTEPDEAVSWLGRGGGFREWKCGGAYIYGVSVEPKVMDIWRWKQGSVERYLEVPLEKLNAMDYVLTGDEICLYSPLRQTETELRRICASKLPANDSLREWDLPRGWYCHLTQSSANAAYVGIALREDRIDSPPGFDRKVTRRMIGLVSSNARDLRWVATLRAGHASGDIRSVLPSDDGAFIAVGGWDCGVAMIEVATQEVLWSQKPPEEACAFYVSFSPDSRVIYAGGTSGFVHAMDTRTGKLLWRACASPSGGEEYGHRLTCLEASPNGQWVAAGTGPLGTVYVFSAVDGKRIEKLQHASGMASIALVHFAPDSSALATFIPGTIKVWKTADWPKAAVPSPPKPTTTTAPTQAPDSAVESG